MVKGCIMPEMPYCPACKHGRIEYPEWVETYEDTQGCSCKWICTLQEAEAAQAGEGERDG